MPNRGKKRKAAGTSSQAGSILAFFRPRSPPKQLCQASGSEQSPNRGGNGGESTGRKTKRARNDNHALARSPNHPRHEDDELQNPDLDSCRFETHKTPGTAERGNGSVQETHTVPLAAKPHMSPYFKRTEAGHEREESQGAAHRRSLSSKLSRTFLRSGSSSKRSVCIRLFDDDGDVDAGKWLGETEVEPEGQPSGSQKENVKVAVVCHREQSLGSGKRSDPEDACIDLTASDRECKIMKQSSKLRRSTRKTINRFKETLPPQGKEVAARGSLAIIPGKDASEPIELREPLQNSETKQESGRGEAGSAAKIRQVTNNKGIADDCKLVRTPSLRKQPSATAPLGTKASRVSCQSGPGVTNLPKATNGNKANQTSNERRSRPSAEKAAHTWGEEEPEEGELGEDDCEDDGVSADVGDGRPDLYLENFLTVLRTVMSHEHDRVLFNNEDMAIIDKFHSLSEAAQKLYVRLFQRKVRWLPTVTLKYARIAADLTAALDELISSELLQSESELTDVSEALSVLPAPELRLVARSFHVAVAGGVHRQQLVEALARLARQRSVLSLMGARGTDANPAVLRRYETASHSLNEMDHAMSSNKLEDACSLYRTARAIWDEMKRSLDFSHEEALPLHLRCMSAGWAYTRMMSRGVEILQRLQLYPEAVEQLHSLLSQQTYCIQRRGSWWDRLALNLQHHLKDTPKAIEAIRQGLTDPYVRTGQRLALHQRAVRIRESPSCKALRHLLRDLPTVEYDEAPKVTIRGKACPQTGMGKSVFLREEEEEAMEVEVAGGSRDGVGATTTTTIMCSVEELALAHYRSQDFDQGLHGEGATFCTLFGLLLWDVIFSDTVPDVFLNPYQGFPLDLYTDGFYENRRELLDERLAQLRGATGAELQEFVVAAWTAHEGEACGLVSWERLMTLSQATSLVASLGGHLLAGVCERLAKNLRHNRGGLPDLVVWSSQTLQCKLVEVKGPSDRLSQKQLLWLHELMQLGAQVEVCHVTAYGARAARLEN
ncbi:fanconi-associated nuclease 1 isoform X3 [Lethenteron reissneri]|uniref:fanconi-associated nuclease 1 isoform X3 n=1 Tax=Lethenteron reissneri TaxID=7753 RepID=UPI002AB678EA|nr:fanconi-associated nuclease 1 isoform X3 [Lethenteron reissneri]